MKPGKACTLTVFLLVVLHLPEFLQAGREVDRWADGPWQSQDMIALGGSKLVVDFGLNGLWIYDGSIWVQISSWNPERMVAWGAGNLTVDFGSNGLWSFDGSSWWKIALGDL